MQGTSDFKSGRAFVCVKKFFCLLKIKLEMGWCLILEWDLGYTEGNLTLLAPLSTCKLSLIVSKHFIFII